MAPVIEDPDRVVVSAGMARVMNGCVVRDGDVAVGACPANPAVAWAVLGGLRSAVLAAGASPLLGAGAAPRGALLVHRTEALRVGGVPSDGTVHDLAWLPWTRSGLRSAYAPLPVSWTRVPSTFADLARAYRRRVAAAFGAIRGLWKRDQRRGEHGAVKHGARFVRSAWTLSALLDPAALAVATLGFGRGDIDFPLLLAVWVSVLVGRTAVSSVAILLHDVTPKRYPSSWDVARLFLAAVFDLTVGRLLALWWTVSTLSCFRRAGPPTVVTPLTAGADTRP
jgi:hypothetical protein